ncbi:hypothetical protein RHMOL_Rhmol01G0345300 [Rhododendron molle]|uniref:Uncharacterized protein n=1 Tax=Rhododendron molle TaxID=49168 RepID=A0ACC0QA84_RHOML|nr:hypothetical protein RHMOL_Rhmol01G0345300 [Rhododendron molle]
MPSSPFFLTILAAALAVVAGSSVVPPPQPKSARAFFVFGDSLVDNGNNNYLVTTARADSPPYGIDYPTHHPTGRFSNGLNLPDIISEQLGMEPTLPILSPELTGHKLLVGANFASAGVGILNDTGFQFVMVTGTGPLGCVPAELAKTSGNGQCAEEPERAAELFNTGLDDMGPYNGIGICNPTSNLCQNRNSYVFWDPYHPTERANRYIVQQMLNGSEKYMHPMNLNTIMARASTN